MINTLFIGFKNERPRCFSFSMNTLFNCNSFCLYFFGLQNKEYMIDQVNFFCHKNSVTSELFVLHFSQETSFDLTFKDSVILSNISKLIDYRNGISASVSLKNCLISSIFGKDEAEYINCTVVPYKFDYIILFPHYTYENECLGTANDKNISAKGCNVDHCIDENCGFTFSFSSGLVPFKTVHHLDFQTATFSNSDGFTKSKIFSFSNYFTESSKFTNSNLFSLRYDSFTNTYPSNTNTQNISSSNNNNDLKIYSLTLSFVMISIKTVSYSSSFTFSKSYYQCIDINSEVSFCETFADYQLMFPYIITSLSRSVVQTLYEHEKILKKGMSSEVLIGVVCGSVSAFFAIVGVIYLILNKRYSIKNYESYISSSSTNDEEVIQVNANINDKVIENINNNDDKWL